MNTPNLIKRLCLSVGAILLSLSPLQAKWTEGEQVSPTHKLILEQASASGAKIVLVDFWASWCAPCKKSFPEMDALYSKYHDKGFSIVAVNLDEKEGSMKTFLKRNPISFPTIADKDKSMVQAAQLDAIPSSYLIDKNGTILYVHRGWHGKKSVDELTEQIEKLLERSQP